MGNRAFVVFVSEDEGEISPAIYLHWNGGPESVYAFLAELDRRGVRSDQEYEAARFISIVAEFFDQDHYTTLSLGVRNGPKRIDVKSLAQFDHGDNGVYVVCRENKVRVRRFAAYPFRELGPDEVKAEKEAALADDYNTGERTIASVFKKATEAEYRAKGS